MEGSPRRTLNGVNQPEEMVTGAGRGQGTRVRLQKLLLFGTASLRTQTYLLIFPVVASLNPFR